MRHSFRSLIRRRMRNCSRYACIRPISMRNSREKSIRQPRSAMPRHPRSHSRGHKKKLPLLRRRRHLALTGAGIRRRTKTERLTLNGRKGANASGNAWQNAGNSGNSGAETGKADDSPEEKRQDSGSSTGCTSETGGERFICADKADQNKSGETAPKTEASAARSLLAWKISRNPITCNCRKRKSPQKSGNWQRI